MKIAHINMAGGFRGGERQTQLLIRALAARQEIAQLFVGRRHSELGRRLEAQIPELEIVSTGRPYWLGSTHVRSADLLHVHEGKAAHFGYMASRRFGIPYVITRRVPNLPKNNPFTRRVYRCAARVVAISTAIRERMLEYDETLNIDVIPSMMSPLTIDHKEAGRIRARFQGKYLVGHIGALVNHHKGQQYIIECARKLMHTHPDIQFLLLGNGKDEAMLKDMAAGLSNIHFEGFVDNVGDYISAFDLFVFPSLEEGLGSILLDVMNAGVPIVASDVDGIPELIKDGKTGLLVPPANANRLGDAILSIYRDSRAGTELAQQAKQFVASFTPEGLAQRYVSLYRELVEE